jgi:acetylornithine deacetylase/succinyl-diaminopimelate desuccinylase-like protein
MSPRSLGAALALALLLPAAAGAGLSREAGWLADYLRVDTTNPPGNEAAAAELLARLLREQGLASERYVSPTGRVSLVARLPATVPAAPVVVLLHHLDVVPAGEGWTVPPFAGEVRDGALWGRGAIDSKGLGVAELAGFLAAARQSVRQRELLLVAAADEETGGGEGTAFLLARHPELFARVEAVVGEGGVNRTVLGRTLFWGIEVAQKRPLWLDVVARGRPGHASSLNPDSATHRLIRALARVIDQPEVWKVTPAARRFFDALAAFDPQARAVDADLDRIAASGRPTGSIQPGMAGLFLDTLQVTQLAGSERINVVAGEARAALDARLLPDTDEQAFLAALRDRLGKDVEASVRLASPPSPPSPAEGPVWSALATGFVGDRPGGPPVVPVFIAGITDARYFRERGIAAYGISPFELEPPLVRTVHGPDERIPLAAFDAGVARLVAMTIALVGGGAGDTGARP